MGSPNKEKTDIIGSDKEFQYKITFIKKIISFFVSFLVSLAGGLTITWWRYEYHPDNRQLWMVPFGLVLLVTPAIVWFSLVFSDSCTLNITNIDQDMMIISRETQFVPSLKEDSIPDPER